MTIIIRGKVIHHKDCTWCKHRREITLALKPKRVSVERCALTGAPIPHPLEAMRYCENYQQLNCECEQCTGTVENQMVYSIDKI